MIESILASLKTQLAKEITKACKLEDESNVWLAKDLLEKPRDISRGDVAFPCFSLAAKVSVDKTKLNPAELASKITAAIELPQSFSSIDQQGPFLNFNLNRSTYLKEVIAFYSNSEFSKKTENPQKILLEYSSPNIAKPFHVGHLRATLIGASLDRIYKELGYEVISVNHLGDWGTQFGFVWAGTKLFKDADTSTVSGLVDIYKRATALSTKNDTGELSEVDLKARDYFIDLEAGKDYAVEFWKHCLEVSLAYFKATYSRLNIEFDHYLGESFYCDKLSAVEEKLKDKGVLENSRGALGVELGEELGFARISTEDGRSLYLSRDIAAATYRHEKFKYDQSIYVVGAPQSLHFKQLIAILEKIDPQIAPKIKHIAFGHVLGIKTRGGGKFVELNEFIDEASERALKVYEEQSENRPEGIDKKEVSNKVGLSAIYFSTLSKSRIKDVNFDWDESLKFSGGTGPYLLYAVARINGIIAKYEKASGKIDLSAQVSYSGLEDETAFRLALKIDEFYDSVLSAAEDNDPCPICHYLLELAQCFSSAYTNLKIVGEDPSTARSRILLFIACKNVLERGLSLLGIQSVKRM